MKKNLNIDPSIVVCVVCAAIAIPIYAIYPGIFSKFGSYIFGAFMLGLVLIQLIFTASPILFAIAGLWLILKTSSKTYGFLLLGLSIILGLANYFLYAGAH